MNEEMLDHEVLSIQTKMKDTDPSTDEYASLSKRLKELEEIRRYSNQEDPETLEVKVRESEGEKDRKSSLALKIIGGVGIAGLMFLSHFLAGTQIMEQADQRLIDKFDRDKDDKKRR